ncbi:pantoate--beta-alanine ligase [Leadbetterella byssophila]|uniref:pantoate--beta-alanine ligase n=1 Tax=Leadbetterella byssophila TaxID=316068 RepID=UPI0039A26E68
MKVLKTRIETQNYAKSHEIGLVPTMGALHDGHLSLIKRAKKDNEVCAASIFVNPIQFNNPEDLEKYPRTLEKDLDLLEKAGCDMVYVPSVEDMYPEPVALKMDFGPLERVLEGAFRPGHFNGVGIVVSKLFHMIKPQRAYFGLKDLQQCAIINRMVKDLNFGIDLVFCDTVRAEDGLALSSRNARLSAEDRAKAPFLYSTLQAGQKLLLEGKSPEEVKTEIQKMFNNRSEFELEYYEIVDFENLQNISTYDPQVKTAIVLAAHLGGVRLIDNILW